MLAAVRRRSGFIERQVHLLCSPMDCAAPLVHAPMHAPGALAHADSDARGSLQVENSLNEIVFFNPPADGMDEMPYEGTRHGDGRSDWSSFTKVSFRTQASCNPQLSHARWAPTAGQILPGRDYYGGSRRVSRSISPALQPYPSVPQTAFPRLGSSRSLSRMGSSMGGRSSLSSMGGPPSFYDHDAAEEFSPRKSLHSLQLGKVNVTSIRATSKTPPPIPPTPPTELRCRCG